VRAGLSACWGGRNARGVTRKLKGGGSSQVGQANVAACSCRAVV